MKKQIVSLLALSILLISHPGVANPRIAVLNFELNDITSLPNTIQEQQRTGSIKPLLEQALSLTGSFEIIEISTNAETAANAGFGYLFSHHDLAAKLGEQFGADWVIVGRHSKPSFLYSYLIADLVEVKSQKLVSRFDIELKGTHTKVSEHGIAALADKIANRLVGQ
jgi:hypothetical protein